MNKNDIRRSFDKIQPDDHTQQIMLDGVLKHRKNKRKANIMRGLRFKRVIPIVALVLILAGGVAIKGYLPNNESETPGVGAERDAVGESEYAALPITNQFTIDDKYYTIMNDELKKEFNIKDEINGDDIGEKIAVISDTPDDSLLGSGVYAYLPAGAEAVVAVRQNDEYKLYTFFNFESYTNNQDEDAIEYLKLYGINNARDIAKIQFIDYSEQSRMQGQLDVSGEIRDQNEIEAFYSYYSVLVNSSDKYFDKLFNYDKEDIENRRDNYEGDLEQSYYDIDIPDEPAEFGIDGPAPNLRVNPDTPVYEDALPSDEHLTDPDTAVHDEPLPRDEHYVDMGEGSVDHTTPSQGRSRNALANSIVIRLYNQEGIYFDTVYYIDLGFISRHEVGREFAQFLADYIE
ncbi:MAG TPA: hypothetical protein VFD33_04280 [Bacillota bacterium]|nr:hypothetical protein [Bacillota bacterium]